MSDQWKPTQKIRAMNTVINQIKALEQRVKTRIGESLSTATEGDLLLNSQNNYMYRVEKISPKTLVLSEGRKLASGYGAFTFGHNPKRIRANTFSHDYYLKITLQEIERSKQLSRRHKFIQNFSKRQTI